MRACLFILALGLLDPGGAACRAAPVPDAATIARRLDELYRSTSSTGRLELQSTTETQSRHLKMRIWTKGVREKTLIIIDEPAREAGTATLKVGSNLWNYLPRISRTIRVPPSMMLSSWMGTDFTNDDLVKDTSYIDDFEASRPVRQAEPAGWALTMTAKPGLVGRWAKIDWLVSEGRLLPIEARFYDRKGRLARTMRYSEVRTLGGRELPTKLSLDSVDQPGHRTEIRFTEMRFDARVPDSVFSLSELEKR